jgi:hypothetical protein
MLQGTLRTIESSTGADCRSLVWVFGQGKLEPVPVTFATGS